MSSKKCRSCSLVNGASELLCVRCGRPLASAAESRPLGPREAARRSSSIYTLLAVTLLGGIVVYLYHGVLASYENVTANEAQRIAAQPMVSPAPLTSRSETDAKRAEPYKNAMLQNNPNLAASQKHNDEIKQLMRAGTNKSSQ